MSHSITEDILVCTHPELSKLPGVRHGFFGRRGGLSQGIYASLNCGPGSNDGPEAVKENRARAVKSLGMPETSLYTLHQCHTADVVTITAGNQASFGKPQADALVTALPGVTLGILTADCTPVLFVDATARVIGAAHAGWKGAIGGVLENTVKAMEALGAERSRIVAAIGPCIRQASYEVGDEFRETFLRQQSESARYFVAGATAGKWQFDLPGYAHTRLEAAGVGNVVDIGRDTLRDADDFFSYRRTCLAGQKDYGRQLSAIALA